MMSRLRRFFLNKLFFMALSFFLLSFSCVQNEAKTFEQTSSSLNKSDESLKANAIKINDSSDYVGSWKSESGQSLIFRENGEFFYSNSKSGENFEGKWRLLDNGEASTTGKGSAKIDENTGEIILSNAHFRRDLI